jgi:hypothetical protein
MIWRRDAALRKKSEKASMRRVLLSTAAMLGFGMVALSAAPALAGYGAIAWDKATGRYGWSRNQATAQKAGELAINGCGATGCKVVIRMTDGEPCGALATTRDGKTAGGASRKKEDEARLVALANCRKNNSGECVIRISKCTK